MYGYSPPSVGAKVDFVCSGDGRGYHSRRVYLIDLILSFTQGTFVVLGIVLSYIPLIEYRGEYFFGI